MIEVCAAGEAAWHAAAYAGLGSPWLQNPELGWAADVTPHRFLLGAVTLAPTPALPRELLDHRPGIINDSWAALSPDDLPGWRREPADPWMFRPPSRCDVPATAGVVVERTSDELTFERTAFLGMGGSAPQQPGELHPVGSHDVAGLHLFLAWRDGVPIGTAIAVRHARGVVVSGVGVLETERRHGVGAMLTAAAVNVDVQLPATLSASDLGIVLYRKLGFTELTPAIHWHPPEPGNLAVGETPNMQVGRT